MTKAIGSGTVALPLVRKVVPAASVGVGAGELGSGGVQRAGDEFDEGTVIDLMGTPLWLGRAADVRLRERLDLSVV